MIALQALSSMQRTIRRRPAHRPDSVGSRQRLPDPADRPCKIRTSRLLFGWPMGIMNHNDVSQRLNRSEDPLRVLIDTTPALIHTALPDGSLDFFNRRWLEYVGLQLSEVLGWGWTSAIHREDVEEFVERWRASVESGEPFECESRVRRADGEYRWFLHRKVAVRDEVGTIIKWYGSSIEIEDRKRAEDCLRRNQAYLAEGQRLSLTGSFGWHFSTAELYWSEETFRIFQYDRAIRPTVEQVLERTHPEDRILVQRTLERAQQERKDFELEHRLLLPDDSVKYLHVVANASLENDEFVGAVTDITAAKRAEQKIRQDEMELRQLIDFLPHMVFVLDPDGDFIHVNQKVFDYTGFSQQQMREVGPETLVEGGTHPDDNEKVRKECDRGISSGIPFEIDG